MAKPIFLLVFCLLATVAFACESHCNVPFFPRLDTSKRPSDFIECNPIDFNNEECTRYSNFLPLSLFTKKIREPLVKLSQRINQMFSIFNQILTTDLIGYFSTDYDDQSVDLSLRLLRHLYSPSRNLVFSPHSLVTALTMTLLGAEGHSRRQLMVTLFGEVDERRVERFIAQHRDLTKYNADELQIGNLMLEMFIAQHSQLTQHRPLSKYSAKQLQMGNFLYHGTSFPLKPEYQNQVSTDFGAITKSVNFSDSVSALKSINSDVSEATQGMIPRLLTEIDPQTVLILLNTVYFKGMWAVPFSEPDTWYKRTFTLSSGEQIQIPMMRHYREEFPFLVESDGTKCLLLSYNVPDLALALFLPPEGIPIESFVSNLTGAFLDPLLAERSNPSGRKVYVTLPRFKISSTHSNLVETLQSLGVRDIFSPKKANLSKLTQNWTGLAVSQVLQKATIEVNEEGTKATAATAVRSRSGIPPYREFEFIANRPFVYALVRAPSWPPAHKQILFMGVVEDPSKE